MQTEKGLAARACTCWWGAGEGGAALSPRSGLGHDGGGAALCPAEHHHPRSGGLIDIAPRHGQMLLSIWAQAPFPTLCPGTASACPSTRESSDRDLPSLFSDLP